MITSSLSKQALVDAKEINSLNLQKLKIVKLLNSYLV